jgi:uncharacterized protein YqgC (DUF456 family)
MPAVVEAVLYVAGFVAMAVGIAGLVLPVLPGAVLIVGGAIAVAWAEDFTRVGWPTIAAAIVLGVLILAVDFVASLLGARAFGASRWAVIGAGVGVVVGLFLGPVGIVLGPAVGAIAFEYARNPDLRRASKAGLGAFLGFVLGSAVKLALGFAIAGLVLVALWR